MPSARLAPPARAAAARARPRPRVDAKPQHARRAARRKHADAAERHVERRHADWRAHRLHDRRHARLVDASPRNTSVRCMSRGLDPVSATVRWTSRARPANQLLMRRRSPASRRREGRPRRTAASGSPALGPFARPHWMLHHHQPHHVERRLRRLELDHVAAAEELKRPHTRFVVADRPRWRPCRPASPACRRPAPRCR